MGIGGQQQPAVRVQVDPQALADRGINLEDVRTVLGQANVDLPKGTLNSPRQTLTLNTNDQLFKRDQYAGSAELGGVSCRGLARQVGHEPDADQRRDT